jgi:hypothetical protein
MGREVRRVPADWQHPEYEAWESHTGLKPLHDGCMYQSAHDDFIEKLRAEGLQAAVDYFGGAPDANDYMPRWSPEEATHYMMYEDTSEGTPISPAFATPEELARWLADNGASSFASQTASYEAWLRVAKGGFAPSVIISGGVMQSGVEALASVDTHPKSGDAQQAPSPMGSAVPKADAQEPPQ